MTLPYCLTSPKLRLVNTRHGFVTLERIAPQSYKVFKEGVYITDVVKFQHWYAGEDNTYRVPHRTRKAAIEYGIVSWYCARRYS